jgi:hypothetical protein
LKRNTVLTIGTIGCSLFISIFGAFYLNASISRSYEIQFHSIKLHGKLDCVRLRKAGITKIIYRVFQDDEKSGGLYFNNTQFRIISPSLEQLTAEFDYHNMELCAWMIGRKFKWITSTFLFDYQFENGRRKKVPKMDIFNPDAVKKITTVFKELASNKIDCILIQDDLAIRYNEGFSPWGRAEYSTATKVPADEAQMMAENSLSNLNWRRVKVKRLNKVVNEIVRNCKMVNTAIKVGMNVYYEAPIRMKDAENWYAHNLRQLTDSSLDYIYLMSYHRQIKEEMKLDEDANRLMFKDIVDKAYEMCRDKLVVKIQVQDWKTGRRIPESEVRVYLNLVPVGVKRVCFTPVTVNDYEYLERIINSEGR